MKQDHNEPPYIHGKYLPHLDGIRALAVLPVLLYHLHKELCPGGFVGVDVFFVISGYLIIGGIFKNIAIKKFSLIQFYHRRIRRIMPAYFSVIGFVALFSSLYYNIYDRYDHAKTIFSSVLFVSNIHFNHMRDYFDPKTETNPLLNLWSLSVEEQFYIIIPVTVLIISLLSLKLAKYFLLVVAFLSLALSIHYVNSGDAQTAFYLLPSRIWELLAGGILAITIHQWPKSSTLARWANAGALVFIFASYLSLNSSSAFPGSNALYAVCASMVLICYGQQGWVAHILTMRPLVWCGKISYSLYLWHWPIFTFWRLIADDALTVWDYAGMLSISFFVAWSSWRFIEQPVRLASWWKPLHSFIFLIFGCSIIGLFALNKLKPARLSPLFGERNLSDSFLDTSRPLQATQNKRANNLQLSAGDLCGTEWEDLHMTDAFKQLGSPQRPLRLVIMGDSHAYSLAFGLDHVLREKNELSGLHVNRRMYHLEPEITPNSDVRQALEWIKNEPNIEVVIFNYRWDKIAHSKPSVPETYNEEWKKCFSKVFKELKDAGKQVIILGPLPTFELYVARHEYKKNIWGFRNSNDVVYQKFKSNWEQLEQSLQAMQQDELCTYIPLDEVTFKNGLATKMQGGKVLYSDNNHVTITQAKNIAQYIYPTILKLMEQSK